MLKEFKEFAIKGNVVDMAIGVLIGAAFTAVVNSVVEDLLKGPLGIVTGGLDFGNRFWVLAEGGSRRPLRDPHRSPRGRGGGRRVG